MATTSKAKLINSLRLFLSREGLNLESNQILEVILEVSPNSFEVSKEQKEEIKAKLLERFKPKKEAPNTSALVLGQAQEMNIQISSQEVSEVANFAQNQSEFENNQVATVRNALIQFITNQHNQRQALLNQAMSEVQGFAQSKEREFHQELGGSINNFFRLSNFEYGSNIQQFVQSISEYQGE